MRRAERRGRGRRQLGRPGRAQLRERDCTRHDARARRPARRRRCPAYLIRRIEQHPLIDVHLETQLTELHPNGDKIAAVTFADASGKAETRAVDAVFLCIGGSPHTDWCSREHVVTDSAGYILTGQDLLAERRASPDTLAARS